MAIHVAGELYAVSEDNASAENRRVETVPYRGTRQNRLPRPDGRGIFSLTGIFRPAYHSPEMNLCRFQ